MADFSELLREALTAEKKTRRVYQEAVATARSTTAKKFFEDLERVEAGHESKVQEMVDLLLRWGQLSPYERPSFPTELDENSPGMGGEEEAERDKVMDILEEASRAEEQAKERYELLARASSSPSEEEVLRRLAEDEELHCRILQAQLHHLSDQGLMVWRC